MDPQFPKSLRSTRPTHFTVQSVHASDAEQRDALAGRFIVNGRPAELSAPVNWLMDPYADRTWRFWLHSLIFLEVLLQRYDASGDRVALEHAKTLTLDWLLSNVQGRSDFSEFAWYDMAVGTRVAYLAYLLRAIAFEGASSPAEEKILLQSAIEHGEWLARPEHYKAGHNHGLYEDGGLFILARQLPFLPEAPSWQDLSNQRFLSTLRASVQWEEGVHLEHSPAYHVLIRNLIDRMQGCGIGGGKLQELIQRMSANAAWFVMPDGQYPQLGDTDLVQAPPWAQRQTASVRGLKTFPASGFCAVRVDGAYLVAAAGYHGHGHKHADELTFCWYELGERLIVDAGRYGYYYDEPGRQFAESGRAHNGLLIDHLDFARTKQAPYGSGITASGSGGDWYAIEGRNPLLRETGVEHTRLWLYRPGGWLIVVDRVEAAQEHVITRYFHFGRRFRVDPCGPLEFLGRSDRVALWVADLSEGTVNAAIIRGQRKPELQGFTFPANRRWRANCVLKLETRAQRGTFVTVFRATLRSATPATRGDIQVTAPAGRVEAVVRSPSVEERVAVTRQHDALEVSVLRLD